MAMQLLLQLRALNWSDKVLVGESPVNFTPNQAPGKANVREIVKEMEDFWEEHQHERVRVFRSYNYGTLAFSLNASGGAFLTFCQIVDPVEARDIDETLSDIREAMSA